MNYTVSINEKKRTITVTLADGTKGVARCCPTDKFDINTGIELALERAKVAKATAIKEKEAKLKNLNPSVMELVKALEKALPKGQMVVVGNGKELTAEQKAWLHSLTDCGVDNYTKDDLENAYEEGHDNGYAEGQDDGYDKGYDEGYDKGYDKGYDEGYEVAEAECGVDESTIAKMIGEIEEVIVSYL
jgi:flagellar biosynthesis/type III secretory pathway protein FliH